MNLHEGHRGRLKERYVKEGGESFATHNLLELLLFYAIPRRDTNVIAHRLLGKFGTVPAVLSASVEELCEVDGISESSAILIHLAGELGQRYCRDKMMDAVRFYTYDDMGIFLSNQFLTAVQERVVVMYLDPVGRLIKLSVACDGNVNSARFSPRDVAATAMAVNASSVVVAHNHPGGEAIPSSDDIDTTRALENVLSMVGVELVEHYVIADDGYCCIKKEYKAQEERTESDGVRQRFGLGGESRQRFDPDR